MSEYCSFRTPRGVWVYSRRLASGAVLLAPLHARWFRPDEAVLKVVIPGPEVPRAPPDAAEG